MAHVLRNKGALCPTSVVGAESAIATLFLDGVCQYPVHPLKPKLFQYLFGAVLFEVHTIKALSDTVLNRLFTGDVGLMTGTP